MKFCSLVLELHLTQNFCHTHRDTQTHRQTHRQTDRPFPKIVKSCSGHPKTCQFIKNRKQKICTQSILFSIYMEVKNIFETRIIIKMQNTHMIIISISYSIFGLIKTSSHEQKHRRLNHFKNCNKIYKPRSINFKLIRKKKSNICI